MTNTRLTEIRAMLESITPGPWAWISDGSYRLATAHSGRIHVMRFFRKGMQDAQPGFKRGKRIVPADELNLYQHPDAVFIAAAPGIVRELLVEIERLQSGFDWLSGQEVSISDFTAPCQCKNEYLQNEECSKGINPDDVCPYYNHRGTGECWVDYIKNIATAKEKS